MFQKGKSGRSRFSKRDRGKGAAGEKETPSGEESQQKPLLTAPAAGETPARREDKDSDYVPKHNKRTLETERGPIEIENYRGPQALEELRVDDGICMFSRHDPERQKLALVNVSRTEGGNVTASVLGDLLVAYIGIHHPSERERWGKAGYPWLLELGAIEVSRNFRKMGLAEAMLGVTFDDPFYDDKIVITTGFTWHWDLEGTGMDKMQYRSVGLELFGRYGFMEMATDEPNIAMDSANLFLVRVGKDASFSKYQKFASLLFANEWESMLRGF